MRAPQPDADGPAATGQRLADEVAKATADAQKAMAGVRTCSDLHGRSRELKGATSGDLSACGSATCRPNQQMFEQIPKLAIAARPALSGPEGCRCWRCQQGRRRRPADRDAISQQLLLQKLEAAGRRYMRDLLRQATIDVKRDRRRAARHHHGRAGRIGVELSLKPGRAPSGRPTVLRARRCLAARRAGRQARAHFRARGSIGPPKPSMSSHRVPVCRYACARPCVQASPIRPTHQPTLEAIERAVELVAERRDRRPGDPSHPEEDPAGWVSAIPAIPNTR